MLLTSRETRRWVIPKGWTATKLTCSEAAAREAYEEAGVVGKIICTTPVGQYRYEKRLARDGTVTCDVMVFLLEVRQQLASWPEQGQRETRWFLPAEAAALVDEPELAALLRSLIPKPPATGSVAATASPC